MFILNVVLSFINCSWELLFIYWISLHAMTKGNLYAFTCLYTFLTFENVTNFNIFLNDRNYRQTFHGTEINTLNKCDIIVWLPGYHYNVEVEAFHYRFDSMKMTDNNRAAAVAWGAVWLRPTTGISKYWSIVDLGVPRDLFMYMVLLNEWGSMAVGPLSRGVKTSIILIYKHL